MLDSKIDLPRFDIPAMAGASGEGIQAVAAAKASSPETSDLQGDPRLAAKSENWLLRAMEQKSPFDLRDGKERPRADRSQPSAAEDDRRADNPLSGYMTQWISTRDQRLLLPAPTDGAAPAWNLMLESNAGETIPGAGAPSVPFVSALSGGAPEAAGAPFSEKIPSNPYLAALEPPLGGSAAPATLMPTTATAVSSTEPEFHRGEEVAAPSMSGAPASDPVKPLIPDFAQPSDDAKYFKPLKRF